LGNCSEPSKIFHKTDVKCLQFLRSVFEILFGGYATPTKCVAFWRLALNSYSILRDKYAIMLIDNNIVTRSVNKIYKQNAWIVIELPICHLFNKQI